MSDPYSRHRQELERAGADAGGYRHAYQVLGEDLAEHVGDDLSRAPVLSYPETAPVVADQIPTSASIVLDAGCGPNPQVSLRLARPGRLIIAMDIAWSTVELAGRVAAAQGAELSGVVGDVEHLPFRRGSIDAVVCDDTIEHVPDDHRAIAELAAAVRAGGTAVLATPNRRSIEVLVRKIKDRVRGRPLREAAYYAAASHLREYGPAEFSRLVSERFAVSKSAVVGWPPDRRKHRIANRIVRALPRVSRMIVIVARPPSSG